MFRNHVLYTSFAISFQCVLFLQRHDKMLDFGQPGLAVFDMDSTLITVECIDEIAGLVGQKQKVSAVTERAMQGELDFAQSLRERVALLVGVSAGDLQQLFEPLPLTPGAEQFISWLHQRGWHTAVVSGGFTWFTDQVQQRLKLRFAQANTLCWHNGRLTGKVEEPIVDAQAKANYLRLWAEELHLPLYQTLAVGDGANDIPMLSAAGFGVAFCAKPAVQQQADLSINEPNLMAIAHYFEVQALNNHG